MTRALVTRPAEDSAPLADALGARGIEPLVDPMLRIELAEGAAVPLDGVQALLFTSTNGVRAFAAREARRDLPAYAVGDATAAAARAAGFAEVKSASGDSAALARLVADDLDAKNGALLHARGAHAAGDLAGALAKAGFELRTADLYRAVPAESLSDETRRALADGTLDYALFFSPRTAETFVFLARAAELAEATAPVVAICLSQPVADALSALSWRAVAVAERPTQSALLAALDAYLPAQAEPAMAENSAPDRPAAAPPARAPTAIAVLALLIALAAAAAGTWQWWGPAVGLAPGNLPTAQRVDKLGSDLAALKSQLAAQMTNLAKRQDEIAGKADANAKALDDVSNKLGALGDRAAKLEQNAGGAAALGKRLDALNSKVSTLADQTGQASALADTVKTLQSRLAALEQAEKTRTREGAGLVMVAASLADAVQNGGPYATPLATISALARNDMDILHQVATLLPHARAGVPTFQSLAARFPKVADAVTRAAIAPPGASWTDRILARLSALVTIRRTGANAKGDSPAAIVARAEADLKAGELAGAVDELAKLSGAPAQAAADWLSDARARLQARSAAKAISDLAMKTYLRPAANAAPAGAPPAKPAAPSAPAPQ